jgi:3-phosphoshikimate 1-carboxyvinyltransferase
MVAPFVFDDITFTGINRLRIKESDRVAAIREQLSAVGIRSEERNDSLTIYGYNPVAAGSKLSEKSTEIIKMSSYNDHRMAMSAILLATILKTKIEIDDIMCIRKSYPEFLDYIDSYYI